MHAMTKGIVGALLVLFVASASAQYTHSTGVRFVHYSSAAYCPSTTLSSWNCRPCNANSGFNRVSVISNSLLNIQGFVGYSTSFNEIVISFRGSTNIVNWISNISFGKKSYPSACQGCQAHGGFLDAYNAVQGQVLNALRNLRSSYRTARVVLTGHSLGAALATIAAMDLAVNQGIPVGALVTFGSPRVGNDMFSLTLRNAIGTVISNRISHNADPVVRVPPMNFGFHHVAREFWYRSATSFVTCNTSGEDGSCANSVLLPVSTSDHLNYLGVAVSQSC